MKNTIEYTGWHPCYAAVSEDTLSQARHICGDKIFLLANLRNASENDNNPPAFGAFNKIMKQMRTASALFFSKDARHFFPKGARRKSDIIIALGVG